MRPIIVVMSICLLIVYINPLKWEAGVFKFLKEVKTNNVQTYVGVVDKIINNKAIILLEGEKREMIINKAELPHDCKDGTWVLINIYSDETYDISVQKDLTEKNKRKSQMLFDQLLK